MKSDVFTKEKIREMIIEFLCYQFLVDEEDIELNESLIDSGVTDSLGLIEIASFLEQKFSMIITENLMVRENFGSINKIVDFIDRQASS